jgi:hypothetical protein
VSVLSRATRRLEREASAVIFSGLSPCDTNPVLRTAAISNVVGYEARRLVVRKDLVVEVVQR